MHSDISFSDGFGNDPSEPTAEYVCWNESYNYNINVFYLHGALHLFDFGHQLRKYTWIRKNVPLIEQARKAITDGAFPLFVSEGSSNKKMNKIRHQGYLQSAFNSFSKIDGSLFIHGLSLSPNDEHILAKIEMGKIKKVFVSLYGDPESVDNRTVISRAFELREKRQREDLEVYFYDSASANIWGLS